MDGLRHIIMIVDAGSTRRTSGCATFGCALSLVEANGNVVVTAAPRGPDRPWLRRQQVLVGIGVAPGAVAIARSLLLVKLAGRKRRCG